MRRIAISMMTLFLLVLAIAAGSLSTRSAAQTQNQTSKSVLTEAFTFPNECTGELMDVTDTTVVTCHDQARADGAFNEKCEIRQDVTATGETTGITFHGMGTFKDELTATDGCNFSFTNRGRVRLISPGSDVNLILTFDDTTIKESCALVTETHLVSADCRGSQQ